MFLTFVSFFHSTYLPQINQPEQNFTRGEASFVFPSVAHLLSEGPGRFSPVFPHGHPPPLLRSSFPELLIDT